MSASSNWPKPVIRKATQEDIGSFSSNCNRPTIKAWCGEVDGRVVAIGGLALHRGRWIAFFDVLHEARKYKLSIVKYAKKFMRETAASDIKFIYAELDRSEPLAETWVKSLGFELDPRSKHLYRWKNKKWQE